VKGANLAKGCKPGKRVQTWQKGAKGAKSVYPPGFDFLTPLGGRFYVILRGFASSGQVVDLAPFRSNLIQFGIRVAN
jgi:hypothetical protein